MSAPFAPLSAAAGGRLTSRHRARAFVIVGGLGFAVQLATLTSLLHIGLALPAATALAVEAAVLHNFLWHEQWTWRDRKGGSHWSARLLRFHTSAAIISLTVNVLLTWMLVRVCHLPVIAANLLSVAAASVANFAAADRWVFASARTSRQARRATLLMVTGLALGILPASVASAQPSAATLSAWSSFVRNAEATGDVNEAGCVVGAEPVGRVVRVADGTIYRWSSCTLVRHITVGALVDRLISQGTPPPQDDVVESRLLRRDGDRLHVYLKLIRRTLLTVSYDTEHEMVFHRESNTHASSRSVATLIRQVDGGDHGFLWRLQSYWQYRQAGPDVRVELVSLSLSRDVPLLVRPVAAPAISSVGRESIVRTLDAMRRFFGDTAN